MAAVLDIPAALEPGDALAQPTRGHLFRILGELGRPATTVELAERLGLHPNGVRTHLVRLKRAGLVVSAREARPRGRPRERWTIAADAQPGGKPPRGYHDLALWLSRAIGLGWPSLRVIEATGREIGREIAPEGASGIDGLVGSLVALGFQPRVARRRGKTVTLCLENCPYADAVAENDRAICALHRGMTRGLLETIEPGARLTDFEPHEPREGGCLIQISAIATGPMRA
jgi:predicted ArsR family transcriptional regulator